LQSFNDLGILKEKTIVRPPPGGHPLSFKERFPRGFETRLTRFILDPIEGKVKRCSELASNPEFPHFDIQGSGSNLRYLYTTEFRNLQDPLAGKGLVRHDLHRGPSMGIEAGRGRVLGEVVFVPEPGNDRKDRGWLLMQGYDANRDESHDLRQSRRLEKT